MICKDLCIKKLRKLTENTDKIEIIKNNYGWDKRKNKHIEN
jgi:hypothetical protein